MCWHVLTTPGLCRVFCFGSAGETALTVAKIKGETAAQAFLTHHAEAEGEEEGETDDEPWPMSAEAMFS